MILQVKVDKVLQWPGKWEGHLIGLRVMRVPETSHISRKVRHELMWMREKIIMENVVRFYGLTSIDGEHFIINEFCPKGALNDLLQNDKYQINLGLKYSLASDVAKGMLFLHQKGIIHGNLNSSCCLLDSKWTVKISDWEHLRLFTCIMVKDGGKKKKVTISNYIYNV
jgi:serine/threonine protein kinase